MFLKMHHGLAGMISGSILNKDDMFLGFIENGFQKLCITFRFQSSFLAYKKETSGEIVDQAKDLVALSNSRSFNSGFLSDFGPGIG